MSKRLKVENKKKKEFVVKVQYTQKIWKISSKNDVMLLRPNVKNYFRSSVVIVGHVR